MQLFIGVQILKNVIDVLIETKRAKKMTYDTSYRLESWRHHIFVQNDEYNDIFNAKSFPNHDPNSSAGTNYEELFIRSFTQNMIKTVFDNQDWSMTLNPIFKYYNGKQW